MEKDSNIDEIFSNYQNSNNQLIEKIKEVCSKKQEKWDLGIEGNSQNLTYLLIYEYASSIEKISNGKLTAEFVIEKLAENMGVLRYGDFRNGIDDNIKYNSQPVTSDSYKEQCRVNSNFGAHEVDIEDGDKIKCAIVLFDNSQKYTDKEGNEHTLSGIDLNDLDDIRHTIFHEWTHIMEKSYAKASDLRREDILLEQGHSTYINSYLSPDLEISEYKDFIDNVDNLLKSDKEILFGGISTIEVNEDKSPDRRIMHNQISEGCTEYISRLVMQNIGAKVKDESRYADQVEFAKKIFESNGLDNSIEAYFTSSNKVISFIENNEVKGKDLLHYADDLITFLGKLESTCKDEIIKSGNNPDIMEALKGKIVSFWEVGKSEEIDEYSKNLMDEFLGRDYESSSNFKEMLVRALKYPKEKQEFDEFLENGLIAENKKSNEEEPYNDNMNNDNSNKDNNKKMFSNSVKDIAKTEILSGVQSEMADIMSLGKEEIDKKEDINSRDI